MTTLFIVAAFIVLEIAGSVAILWALARLFTAPNNKWRHVWLAISLALLASALVTIVDKCLQRSEVASPLSEFFVVTLALGALAVYVLIYQYSFGLSWLKSIGILVAYLLCVTPFALGSAALLKSQFVEPFTCNGLACAPTLVGRHRADKCPHCGGDLVIRTSDPDAEAFNADDHADDGICLKCRKSSAAANPSGQIYGPDLIMTTRGLSPERWSLVTYTPNHASPGDPMVWVGRVVGLPGERVLISDGSIFINGERMTPPSEISGINYESRDADGQPLPNFTHTEATLSKDEFCILGDFSRHAYDSRYLGAVARARINSVVTVCYWPPSRWRIWH